MVGGGEMLVNGGGPTHQVHNGSFTPVKVEENRVIDDVQACLTVFPDGRTAAFVKNGLKINRKTGQQWQVSLFTGECDGVRCYVYVQNGKTFVFLGRREMEP